VTTLVAGTTALAGRLVTALGHGDPDDCLRLYERDARLLLDEADTDPTLDGVRDALQRHSVEVVIDANDPFMDGVSPVLEAAARDLGVPHRRVAPPSFEDHPGARRWRWVDTLPEAAEAAWGGASTPMVALTPIELCAELGSNEGRGAVAHRRATLTDRPFPPWLREPHRPVRATTEAVALMEHEATAILLVNDSGDPRVRPFLHASRLTGVEVVMLRRPPRWRAPAEVEADARGNAVVAALKWRTTVL
jgi:precorrin-6x reductase